MCVPSRDGEGSTILPSNAGMDFLDDLFASWKNHSRQTFFGKHFGNCFVNPPS